MPDIITVLEDVLGIFGGSADSVGIFDSATLNQVFVDARPMKATVIPSAKLLEHPAETGIIIADHKVINPVEVEFSLMITAQFYGSVYQQIAAAFANSTLLIAQTRTGVYPNMVIDRMPHEENPETFDTIVMALRLKEVLFVPAPSTYAPADPVNEDTVQNGQQQGITPAPAPSTPTQYGATGAW